MTPGGDGVKVVAAKAAALARRALARTAVSLALFAAGAALSLFWSSFLVQRASHSLDSATSPRALSGVVGGAVPGDATGAGTGLTLDTGPQASTVASELRVGSAGALVSTAVLLPAGLVLTPARRRRQVLARIGRWGVVTGGVLTAATWIVPAVVAAFSSGNTHHLASTVTSADAPGRGVALLVLAAGGALLLVAHRHGRRHPGLVFPVGTGRELPVS